MTELNLDHLQQWLGNTATATDTIDVRTANLMNATLDRTEQFQPGDVLPPLWHWLYFHDPVPAAQIGNDGHATLGGFLPPVPLPRRMWAGGKLQFERPLHIGETATKTAVVKSITPKSGRSGALCFVAVEHQIYVGQERCLTEEQTLVYRAPADSEAIQPPSPQAPTTAQISHTYHPDQVMLFRYSALTFNSHRIHYDVDFVRHEEGYPDLIVHGPLIATLLLDLIYHQLPTSQIATFDYRAKSPLFLPQPFTVNGRYDDPTGHVWAANHLGGLAMEGHVTLTSS